MKEKEAKLKIFLEQQIFIQQYLETEVSTARLSAALHIVLEVSAS